MAGVTGVALSATVRVVFNEPMNAATLTASTIVLRNAANALVPATVSYDAPFLTGVLTPTSPLSGSTTYTATITGGSAGVKDMAGNALATNYASSFTTAASGPVRIFSGSTAPTTFATNETTAVELGVKFRADVGGMVTGVRFYKGTTTTGTHTGTLWTSTGTMLATVTFTGETASGWQKMLFSSPVAITANTVYVVSYHTNVGQWAYTDNTFASAGVNNATLHALQAGVSGPNGVFDYGAATTFPTSGFNSRNYWVDIIFVQQ
jgi:hypothetical protein